MKLLSSVVLLLAAITLTGCADETPLAPQPTSPLEVPQLAAAKGKHEVVPGEYVVVFRGSVTDVPRKTRDKTRGRKAAKHTYTAAVKGFAAELSDADVAVLRADPDVAFVEPNRTVSITTTQTGAPWGLDRLDQRTLPLSGTYDYATDASGVRVYVFDTGILFGHAEFGGRAVPGIDAITPGGSASDCNGHGTHVAGTVGGATYGVAKRVQLVAVRVLDCEGNGTTSTLIAGIDWVTKQKQASPAVPMVGNLSLGGGISASLDAAIASSIAAGITYVVAAGNSATDACLGSPSRLPEAITVAASDASDSFASFSSHGACVDIVAPGVGIASAYIGGTTAVATANGTSMATPHVAGAAALYLAGNTTATPAQVTSALLGAATTGRVANRPAGTPDRLLHTGAAASVAPAPAPARVEAQLQLVATGQCVTLPSSAIATAGTLAPCTGAAGQLLSLPGLGGAGAVQLFAGSVCLDDFGARGQSGDVVGIYTCFPGTAQQTWTLNADGELRGINGLCLAAAGGGTTLQTCTGASSQRWATAAVPPTARYSAALRLASTGQCVTLPSSAIGTIGTLAACTGAADQLLSLPPDGLAGAVQLFNGSVCLDDFGARGLAGDNVGIYTCAPGAAKQTWTLNTAGELRGINNLCLTAGGGITTLQACDGGTSQRWTTGAAAPVTPPPTTPPPTTTPPPSGRFEAQLQSVGAGKCITLPSAEIGTIATLATCAGAAGQKLSLPARGTAGAVQLYGATVCLDDFGARGQVGDWVGIYTCAPGTAKQTWTLNAAGELRGINDLCVTVSGFYTTLQTCTGAATQRWTAL